jgi:hydrogenase nickel incorporation protein HypA/HybF
VHELAIAQSVVDQVAEHTVGRQVVAVNLRVGTESGVVPDALTFSFDVVVLETPLEGATLLVEEVPGRDLALVSVELRKEESCA